MLREALYFEDVIYRLESLMVFNNLQKDEILNELKEISAIIVYDKAMKGINEKYYLFAAKLLRKAEELGLSGNVLSQYSAYLFLKDRNCLSLACENGSEVKSSTLYAMALKDMGVLQYLMDFDLKNLCENVGYGEKLYDYTPSRIKEYPEIEYLRSCQSVDKLLEQLIWQYSKIGTGDHVATTMYRIGASGELVSIFNHKEISFKNIYGYARQKDAIKENTDAFIKGEPAGTLLLTGSRGIGKYSCLKALSTQYSDKDLRIIEAGKQDFKHMNSILANLAARGKKFIIIIDELSAEVIGNNYDDLKICLGGSLEMRPKNVLLYAVCNSGALDFFDKTIDFDNLDEKEYQTLTAEIAKGMNLSVPMDFLMEQAGLWVADKNERSYITAKKFIEHVIWELKQK